MIDFIRFRAYIYLSQTNFGHSLILKKSLKKTKSTTKSIFYLKKFYIVYTELDVSEALFLHELRFITGKLKSEKTKARDKNYKSFQFGKEAYITKTCEYLQNYLLQQYVKQCLQLRP